MSFTGNDSCRERWQRIRRLGPLFLFFFKDTATTEIYTLSLHDALPISSFLNFCFRNRFIYTSSFLHGFLRKLERKAVFERSEEHTSELQSRQYLVCRLLLAKKNPQFLPISTPISISGRWTPPRPSRHTS